MLNILTIAVIGIAVITDFSRRKIYNWLTFSAVLLGVVLNTVFFGFNGALNSLQGLFLGLLIFFIPFALGGVGAGDVKLLGAVGALIGWPKILWVELWTALAGGVFALLFLLMQRDQGGVVLRHLHSVILSVFNKLPLPAPSPKDRQKRLFPYSIAVLAGYILMLFKG